jgi:hypothetical protein
LVERIPALLPEQRTAAIDAAAGILIQSVHRTGQRQKHVQAITDQLVKAVEKAPENK